MRADVLRCWMTASMILCLACGATLASPTMREYVEVQYDMEGTPAKVTRTWQLDDNQTTKMRVVRDSASYVMVVDRGKQVLKLWLSRRPTEVFVVEQSEVQRKLVLPNNFSRAVPPESTWKPLGERQVANIRCKGWLIPTASEGSSSELWVDEDGSVVYSVAFHEGRVVSQQFRLRSSRPSASDRSLFILPSPAKERRIDSQELGSLLLNFFTGQ